MNSLDAILALCALLAGIALLLSAITSEGTAIGEAQKSLEAKTTALSCSGIIDSILSNSSNDYSKTINCTAEQSTVSASAGTATKTARIIGNANKEIEFHVETIKHYLEGEKKNE